MMKIFLTSLLLMLLGACATQPDRYSHPALAAKRPLSILVMPPQNDSIEVQAPYVFLSTVSRPLAEKGYYVFPVAVIDTFLKENGLPTPAEMNTIPLNKIREHIGADAVLYVHIHNWGQKFQIINSRAVVSAELRLVDTETGALLWQGRAHAEQSSNADNESSLAGKLLIAVAEQVAGSIVDNTPELSRIAIHNAIGGDNYGLLRGPYRDVIQAAEEVQGTDPKY